MSTEPSTFGPRPERSLTLYRFIGFATKRFLASPMVSDQNALLGGRPPGAKCIVYVRRPLSLWPAPSLLVVQYIASCGTFTGPGNSCAHAALNNIPLPGTPSPNMVIQPLTFTAQNLARIWAVMNPATAPTTSPCQTSVKIERSG